MYDDLSKLMVYQKSHALVLKIYKVTSRLPKEEQYGLSSQMRRAAVSIPSNIVEGKARGSNKEYKRFLHISRGSLEELKYQILLSKDLGYIREEDYQQLTKDANQIGKMLNGLIRRVDY